MTQYAPNVEQWRPLVAKYFKPEDVDKALYVIQNESSGQADAKSSTGGYGLFQLNDGGLGEGLTTAQRLDPETNVKTAAAAVYGGSGWKPWGEGTNGTGTYDPKTGKGQFGSLGDRPYGGTNVTTPASTDTNGALSALVDLLRRRPVQDQFTAAEYGDQATADAAYNAMLKDWAQAFSDVASGYKVINDQLNQPNKDAQSEFDNKIKTYDEGLATGKLQLDSAAQALTSWLQGRQDNTQRSQQIQSAKDQAIKYGAPAGKTQFSYDDLGRSLFASKMGIDPSTISASYPGQITLDPEADMNRLDAASGFGLDSKPKVPQFSDLNLGGVPAWAKPTGQDALGAALLGIGTGQATTTPPAWAADSYYTPGNPGTWQGPLQPGQTSPTLGVFPNGQPFPDIPRGGYDSPDGSRPSATPLPGPKQPAVGNWTPSEVAKGQPWWDAGKALIGMFGG